MCGIAGILSGSAAPPPSLEELRRMIAMLGHRGPDGIGYYLDDSVGLAHARLSIVDLAGGFQPLANEDGRLWISFNGEIFNHVELRRELEARGHVFATRSDTETIVHAYEEFGADAWPRLNGQFAFALWDGRQRRLWLVRDPFGILPLVHARAGRRLLFASEAKALFGSGLLAPRFDPAGLAHCFSQWAVPAPGTVFQDVASLRPGSALCFDAELRPVETRFWEPRFDPDPGLPATTPAAAALLGEHLRRAVEIRLRADVPVGAYISGGLDSSVIGALIRQVDRSPLQSFSVRFRDPAFDETGPQRRMAALLGTDHHEVLAGPEEIGAALADVVWHCETPLLRTAPVPLFLLSGLVRQAGMKVVLTGEGADELLAGYDLFKEDRVRRFCARNPASAMRAALLSRLYPDVAQHHPKSALWQRFFRSGLAEAGDAAFSHRLRWRTTAWTQSLLAPALRDALPFDRLVAELEDELPRGWRQWSPLAQAQAIEMHSFLTPYLLACQGDRVAMAHGVEVRYPFLDPEVAAFCLSLPDRFKMVGLREKLVLRRLADGLLPPELARRPKRPYRAPMALDLTPDGPFAELLSDGTLRRSDLIDAGVATRLVARARGQDGQPAAEREQMGLIGLITLQLLARAFLDEFGERARWARARLSQTAPAVLIDRRAARQQSA